MKEFNIRNWPAALLNLVIAASLGGTVLTVTIA
ncbi:hypothetical protein ELI_11715 [Erythrobacter litoralis HTCC2594]|uniref:Uncharacterized protein n=1 Tax=Erythrobacter litoralis (strain HTCC2594) TaxID=314225 RepID=Q2N7A6_ERYLH|nr:hypothetical protein ELI_11715 [Erythrobacter litoralis HTCC2594]